MTFQEKLAHTKKRIESNWPDEVKAVAHGATRALEASGIQSGVIKEGVHFPEFDLYNQDQELVNLKDLLQKGPVLVTFYRGVWCPYCNVDLANLNRYLPQVEEVGATMVAISPELPEYSKQAAERNKIGFDILWDKSNQLAEQLGLAFTLPDDLQELYKGWKITLDRFHDDENWQLPMPARFLIDQEGVVRYAESLPDYTQRPDPDEVMKMLEGLV